MTNETRTYLKVLFKEHGYDVDQTNDANILEFWNDIENYFDEELQWAEQQGWNKAIEHDIKESKKRQKSIG
jgi:hypothetical protein